jgi:hypothetical protein
MTGARGSVVGLRHYDTNRKVSAPISDEVIEFLNRPNSSSRTMALGSTQSPTEMSTRNLPGGKKRPALKVDNFADICEQNAWKCGSLNLSQP